MKQMRLRLAALALGICALAAGCGGGGSGSSSSSSDPAGTVPAGASIAPASSASFVYTNTDFSSEQWQRVASLFGRFPGGKALLAKVEQGLHGISLGDLEQALGPETDVVYLQPATGESYVALSKPGDPAKLKALLAKAGQKTVTEQVEGWTVVADSQVALAAFDAARKSGVLADSDSFKTAMQQLPATAATKLYVNGSALEQVVTKAVQGLPSGSLGTLGSIAAAAVAEQDGVSLVGQVVAQPKDQLQPYTPELPSMLPAGALLYVSFAHLDKPVARILDELKQSQPKLSQDLNMLGLAGLSLQGDVLPLLANEGAIVAYPAAAGGKPPGLALVLKLSDEAKARGDLDRVANLARVSGGAKVGTLEVGGARLTRITVQNVSVLAGVFDGLLVVTDSDALVSGLQASGQKLADDPLYQQAVKSAGMPKQVLGFVYANLRDGLPYVFSLAQSHGTKTPATTLANTKPLQSVLLWASSGSGDFPFGGFVTIK